MITTAEIKVMITRAAKSKQRKSFNQLICQMLISTLTFLQFVFVNQVNAQQKFDVAECEELKTDVVQGPFAMCTEHLTCQMVMSLQGTCAVAHQFLSRLGEAIVLKGRIDLNDIFEAAAPQIGGDQIFFQASEEIRIAVEQQTGKSSYIRSDFGIEVPYINGKFNGAGVQIQNGVMFRGHWVNSIRSGKGETVMFDGGVRIVGTYVKGRLTGNGIARYADGHRYEGEWVSNKYEGRGIFTRSDGFKYTGEFSKGNFHGQGEAVLPKGNRLIGEFRNGKLFNGKRILADGSEGGIFENGTETVAAASADSGSADKFLSVLGAVLGTAIDHRAARQRQAVVGNRPSSSSNVSSTVLSSESESSGSSTDSSGRSEQSVSGRNDSKDYAVLKSMPECSDYYLVSSKNIPHTNIRKLVFGIRNICREPVYILWQPYRDVNNENNMIEYVSRLPGPHSRSGAGARFGPGESLESKPIDVFPHQNFHVKILSTCPTEEVASRISGKEVKSVLRANRAGYCLGYLNVPRGVGVSN